MSSAVSTSLATSTTHPCYFYIRRLQSLTGILFGGYLCVHLLVNATLIQGRNPDIFQMQVDKIHSLPFLQAIEWAAIFGPIIAHALLGLYVIKNGKPNLGSYSYVKNWFYVLQRVSAIALTLFLVFHIGGMFGWFGKAIEFEPHNAFQSTVNHIHYSPLFYLVIYPLGVLAGTFHLANGFWTGAISWGLTVSKQSQNRWGWVCLLMFLGTTGCGFAALLGTFIHKNPALAGSVGVH